MVTLPDYEPLFDYITKNHPKWRWKIDNPEGKAKVSLIPNESVSAETFAFLKEKFGVTIDGAVPSKDFGVELPLTKTN